MKRNVVSWAALVVSSAALLSSNGLLRPLPAAPKISPESQKTARALSDAFNSVADTVKPSVVQISVKVKSQEGMIRNRQPGQNGPQGISPEDLLEEFFRRNGRPRPQQFEGGLGPQRMGTGSGFVYDDHGHILTNNHVVDNAAKIVVTFHDGVEAAATVVGTDPKTDLAVIKVDNTTYPALPCGQSSKLKAGELVMAVGSPFGLSHSVSTGIISATERNSVGQNEFESFLQTDAAINPGNSGGPLVDMDGRAVGINSMISTRSGGNEGVGFAIPIDMATTIAESLIKTGKVARSRVGIMLSPLTPVLAQQLGLDAKVRGVIVGKVVPGGPAAKAGLQTGDVITGFKGDTVRSLPTFRLAVSASPSGKSYDLTYIRDGKEQSTTIVPAPYEEVTFFEEEQREAEKAKAQEAPKIVDNDFGLQVQDLTPELAEKLGYAKGTQGLLISEVKENSPAEAAGLRTGELVTRVIKDKKVQNIASMKDFQGLLSKESELALFVESPNARNRFVTLSKTAKD